MGEVTAISWCDHTFNPWIGCTKVSPACDGCYAEAMMDKRYGRVQWGAPGKGVGTRERTSAGNWSKPKAWDRKAKAVGLRPFVFCSSLADVFDNQVPTAWRTDLFELIYATPHLVWLLLTKRPQNIVRQYGAAFDRSWPRNAAIGTTVEDQTRFDANVPALREARAELSPAFAFLSCEPLLGPMVGDLSGIDWVITGGETDQGTHKARPSHPAWYRSLRKQCADAGIAYHHKQNGEWVGWIPREGNPQHRQIQHVMENGTDYYPGNFGSALQSMIKVGKSASGRLLDGVEHNARPEVA